MNVVGALSYAGTTATFGTITIDHTKCGGSNSTNFTVLVSVTNAKYKTIANGGKVANASGFDIVFTADLAGTTLLSWEIEYWNGTTGQLIAWVLISSVSASVDTVFYTNVGNTAYTTFQGGATGAAWNSAYKLVCHYPDGTTLSAADSTANVNNGTVGGTVNAAAGQVDGCASFPNTLVNLISYGTILSGTGDFTMQCWINFSALAARRSVISLDSPVSGQGVYLFATSLGKIECDVAGAAGAVSSASVSTGTWYQIGVTFTGGNLQIYINGVADGAPAAMSPNISSIGQFVGSLNSVFTLPLFGLVDEVNISNVGRAASWMLTQYNNTFSPSTFLSLSI